MATKKSQSDQMAEMMQQMIAMQSRSSEQTIEKKPFAVTLNMMLSLAGSLIVLASSGMWQVSIVKNDIDRLKEAQIKQERTNNDASASIQTLTSMLTSLQADVKEIKNNTSRR